MTYEERLQLFRQLMWDYNIAPEEVDAVLRGEKEIAGHYTREMLFKKLLETYSWFTILQLFSVKEIKEYLSNGIYIQLRSKSLQNKYQYAEKRLQEFV